MIVAGTGHRPDKLEGKEGVVFGATLQTLIELKPERVISGLAPGFDILILRAARQLGIPVTAAIPWIGHPFVSWKGRLDEYLAYLDMCDQHHVVCEGEDYHPWFFQKRNEWMVDNSNTLVACWNGTSGGTKNCLDYAKRVGRDTRYLDVWG